MAAAGASSAGRGGRQAEGGQAAASAPASARRNARFAQAPGIPEEIEAAARQSSGRGHRRAPAM
jgi:hypothetical protein